MPLNSGYNVNKGSSSGSSNGDGGGTDFTPSKTNLYAAVKAIFHPATNAGVDADDTNAELDVLATGTGGASSFSELTGMLADSQVGARTIGAGKLVANSVTKDEIGDDAVGTDEIADAAVTQAKLAPGVGGSPGFRAHTPLTAPADVTADVSIPRSGTNPAIYTLLDAHEFAGPISSSLDFFTEWEGSVVFEMDAACRAHVILHTIHAFGTGFAKTFDHVRTFPIDCAADTRRAVSLGVFDSVSQVPIGTFRGITITEADLALPSKITYQIEIQSFQRKGNNRNTNTLKFLSFESIDAIAYQIGTGNMGGADAAARTSAAAASTAAAAAQATADAALPKAGGTMTGKITLDGAPTANLHAATKKYVDDNAGASSSTDQTARDAAAAASTAAAAAQTTADAALPKAGGTMTGKITLDGAPTANLHAATKKYVDDNAGSGNGVALTDDAVLDLANANRDADDRNKVLGTDAGPDGENSLVFRSAVLKDELNTEVAFPADLGKGAYAALETSILPADLNREILHQGGWHSLAYKEGGGARELAQDAVDRVAAIATPAQITRTWRKATQLDQYSHWGIFHSATDSFPEPAGTGGTGSRPYHEQFYYRRAVNSLGGMTYLYVSVPKGFSTDDIRVRLAADVEANAAGDVLYPAMNQSWVAVTASDFWGATAELKQINLEDHLAPGADYYRLSAQITYAARLDGFILEIADRAYTYTSGGSADSTARSAAAAAQADADSNTGDIDDLRHLTRDLHSPAPSNNWLDASDSDGDMYQALGSSTDALTDANFNNEGASLTVASNASTQVYVRLPIGVDHTDYRIVFGTGFNRSREGNLWTVPSYPAAASTTYQYWRADGFVNGANTSIKLQKREASLNNTFFSGRLEGAALDQIDDLQHLTRDLHTLVEPPTWEDAADADGDVYQVIDPGTAITLTDANFNNNGATVELPEHQNAKTIVFVRLPAATDHTDFRITFDDRLPTTGNTWREKTGPTATFKYYRVTEVDNYGNSIVQLEKKSASIDGTRYDGSLGGAALDQLPPAVLAGTREPTTNDGKDGDFWVAGLDNGSTLSISENVLGSWVEIGRANEGGEGGGGPDTTARSAAAAAQATADAALSRTGGTMTGKITLDGPPNVDLHAATKKYVDDNIGSGRLDGGPFLEEIGQSAVLTLDADTVADTGIDMPDSVATGEVWAIKVGNERYDDLAFFFPTEISTGLGAEIGSTLDPDSGAGDNAGVTIRSRRANSTQQDTIVLAQDSTGNIVIASSHNNLDPSITLYRVKAGGGSSSGDDSGGSSGGGGGATLTELGTHAFTATPAERQWIDTSIDISEIVATDFLGLSYDFAFDSIVRPEILLFSAKGLAESTAAPTAGGNTANILRGSKDNYAFFTNNPQGANDGMALEKSATGTLLIGFNENSNWTNGALTLYKLESSGGGSSSEGGGGSTSPETLYEDATAHTYDHDGFRNITLSRAPAAGTVLQFNLTSEPTNLMSNTIYMSSDAFLALEVPDTGATGYNANWPSPGNKAWIGVAPAAVDTAARITYTVGGNEWSHLTFLFVRRQSDTSMDVLYTFDGIDRSASLKIEEMPNGSVGGGGGAQLKDLDNLPAVAGHEEGDLVAVDDLWYKLATTDETTANLFGGDVGRDVFNTTAGERWRGISNSRSPNGFSTDGEFTANPNNTLSLLLASSSRHIRVAMKRSVYEAAKGSTFSPSDHIAIKVTMADGTTTDEAVLAYYNAYERTDRYIIWQHRHASDNYNLYDEAAGNAVTIEFFTTSGSPPAATTTPLFTHEAALKHWIHWPTGDDPAEDGRNALALAQANAARLDALDMHVDGIAEPIHSQTYDDNTALLAPLAGNAGNFAISQAFTDILPDDLLVVDWKKCEHLNHHDEYVVPGSDTDSGRMYLSPRNFDNTEWNGEFVYALDRAIQDNGAADTLNSWIVGSILFSGSTLTFGLHLQQGGTRTNRNLKPQAGFSLTLRIYRNSAQAVPTSAPFKGIELGRLIGHDSNHLGEQPWTSLATGVTTADGPGTGYSHWLSIPMHSYLTLPTGLGIILEMTRTGVTTQFSQVFIPWHAIGNWDSRATSYPMWGGSWKASGTSNNDRIEVRGRINAGRIELQAACGGADDEGTLHAYIAT